MYCIGLTGPVASGKSHVSALFAKQSIEVISADHIARSLTDIDQPAYHAIVDHFGSEILTEQRFIHRARLRQIIFADHAARQWLENLLHPLIRSQIETKVHASQSPYVVVEIPLLTDKSHYPYLNRVLLVIAAVKNREQRLIARDHCTPQLAKAIINAQPKDAIYHQVANDILINDNDMQHTEQAVLQLHHRYLQDALKQFGDTP